MCGGVKFKHEGQVITAYFPNPKAMLPVALKSGGHELLPWGRREGQPGALPRGGWARLDSIKAGKWNRYSPTPVHLDVDAFMEKDASGKSHWYDLEQGSWIQGLVAAQGDEQRVYVVTIVPKEASQRAVHNRWPRIVSTTDMAV